MEEISISESRKFTGKYKGIPFLISHHGVGDSDSYRPDGTWCFYLMINENQLPDEYRDDFILPAKFDDKGRLSHDYYSTRISDLDWHGGITYYSKEGGADGEKIVIKMGCDYAHSWDEGATYNKETILYDVKKMIDGFLVMFPEIKMRSNYFGGYFKSDEGEFNKNGDFISFSEREKWEKKYPKTVGS